MTKKELVVKDKEGKNRDQEDEVIKAKTQKLRGVKSTGETIDLDKFKESESSEKKKRVINISNKKC